MTSTTSHSILRFTRLGRVLTILLLCLSCVAAYWLASASTRLLSTESALTVSPHHLDLGDVWEHPNLTWLLPIQNSSTSDIEITGFTSSCNCTDLTPPSLTVPARQTVDVRLTIDLTKRPHPDLDQWPFDVELVPQLRAGLPNHKGWTIRGRVSRAFKFSPPSLDFEENLVRGKPLQSRTVDVECLEKVEDFTAACVPPFARVHVTRLGRAPDKFQLRIMPQDSLPGGGFSFEVRTLGVTPTRQTIPGVLPVVGRLLEDIHAIPESVAFANPVGEIHHEVCVLRSRTGKKFEITGFKPDSDSLSVTPLGMIVAGWPALRLSQRVVQPGHHENQLRIFLTSEDGTAREVSVSVTYHGTTRK